MQDRDLALLMDAAKHAGKIALSYHGKSPKTWEKIDNAGPVTQADLDVDDYLRQTLTSARPDYKWLSEETTDDGSRLSAEVCFIVDPIDGTREFINGGPSWSHSLAIAHQGVVTQSVVFAPKLDRLYSASLGAGAFINGQKITISENPNLDNFRLLAPKIIDSDTHWKQTKKPQYIRTHRPSIAYRLALIAEGKFDAMLTLRDTWEWDICAGTLLVTEAGGKVTTLTGNKPLFNNKQPKINGLIAAHPKITNKILDALNF